MSSFLSKDENGEYIKEIESLEVCRWKINEVCCNDKSEYLADYPSPFCQCRSKKDCDLYEKEEGTDDI